MRRGSPGAQNAQHTYSESKHRGEHSPPPPPLCQNRAPPANQNAISANHPCPQSHQRPIRQYAQGGSTKACSEVWACAGATQAPRMPSTPTAKASIGVGIAPLRLRFAGIAPRKRIRTPSAQTILALNPINPQPANARKGAAQRLALRYGRAPRQPTRPECPAHPQQRQAAGWA